jgi:lysophospholipase L1-like esterase
VFCLLTGCLRDADQNGKLWIGVAGDSNSQGASWWVNYATKTLARTWVVNGDLIVREPVGWINRAQPGESCQDGFRQVDALLAAGADVLILAFGTNDLRPLFAQTPRQVVDCYQALAAKADGRLVLVATTPPMYGSLNAALNPQIDALNQLVRATFPRVVEFHDGFTVEMFSSDGVHLNETGWRLRTLRAVEALLATPSHLTARSPKR